MGGMMSFSGPESWSNQACGLALDAPVTPAEIDRLVAFYVDRGVEPRVEVCPFAHDTLIDGLAERGFITVGFDNCLARDLSSDRSPLRLPEGVGTRVRVRRIDQAHEAEVLEWVRVSNSAFAEPGTTKREIFDQLSILLARHPWIDPFVAEIDGVVAGAGAVEVSRPTGGPAVAALIATSVLPEYRRRGVQQALMLARLEQARTKGAVFASIQSKPGIPTERNARRLGFQVMYTKSSMVLRRPGLARSV